MAQESCNLDKDEPEILKPSSSSTPPPPPSPPTAPAAPSSMFLKAPPHDHPLQRSERPEMPDVTNSHTQKPFKVEEVEKEPYSLGVEISTANSGVTSCCSKRKLEDMQHKPSDGSTNRCFSCQKRVGLTGFRCRCGDLFCSRHRHSNAHNCSFDYKAAGRKEIAKANPVIRAAKIIKI